MRGPQKLALPPEKLAAPTKETVREWIRKDLESAHYLLGLVLKRYPEIVIDIANSIHEHAMTKENGAAIDHTKPVNVAEEAKGYAD